MKLARGTSTWFYVSWVTAGLLLALALYVSAWVWLIAAPALVLALLMLNFFRDPERVAAEGICAPADGVIHGIEPWGDGGSRVITFMNPLNVHVNRAPLAGRIVRIHHHSGSFLPAFKKESERNERVEWTFETEIGEVKLVQITGAVARRIVPYLNEGEKVNKGDRIGMIRLGSRVDLYLPKGAVVLVKLGQKVHAGTTPMARIA